MAKLGDELASKVENATNPNVLMDDGIYLATLDEVELYDGGKTPVWNWKFTIDTDDRQPYGGRKIVHKTWISDAAFWRLRETFEAFGVSASTDTDELIGSKVRVKVTQKDNYKGELDDDGLVKLVNEVDKVLPAAGEVGVDESKKARRAQAREAALAALTDVDPVAQGSEEPLF